MTFSEKGLSLDPVVIKKVLKEMDKDVATRFVASAFSLNSKKVRLAFEIAIQEMSIRQKEAKKKRQDELKKTGKFPPPPPVGKIKAEESKQAAKEILDSIAALFKSPGMEAEVEFISEEDLEEDEDEE